MKIQMNSNIGIRYSSNSQKARVITEQWVRDNMFCPRCNSPNLLRFKNNKPVADFYCPKCQNQYELKSKSCLDYKVITCGSYDAMVKRLMSSENPDFFIMSYNRNNWSINNLFIVPKNFIALNSIKKRKELSQNARRAGWVGCNIDLSKLPSTGMIPVIINGKIISKKLVREKFKTASSLDIKNINARGWLLDVLLCIEKLPCDVFSISDLWRFKSLFAKLHPNNNNIRPKIRQQIQILLRKGIIIFIQRGQYKKNF